MSRHPVALGSAGGGAGTVTHTGGALTNNAAVFGAGSADIKVDSSITTDGSGNLTAVSFTTSGAGSAYTEWTTSGFGVSGAGKVRCGAFTGNILGCSDNAGAVTAMAMIAGDLGGTQGAEQVVKAHFTSEASFGTTFGSITTPNDNGTGTTVNLLAKINASGNAVITATSDQADAVGIVTSGAGTTGSAHIAVMGQASCVADNTVTAGDYIGIGTATAGRCKSLSAVGTYPASGLQVIGRAMASAALGAGFNVFLYPTLKTGTAGTVTSITAGTNLTGGTITSSGTIGLGTAVDVNLCTTSPAAGAYTPAGSANAVECLGAGTYTLPTSVTTISNSSSVIYCTTPGAIIARGSGASGIKFTGNQSGIIGCTLDDGAFTSTARFVELAGSDNFVKSLFHQNPGTVSSALPTIDATNGAIRPTVDGIRFIGAQVDPCVAANYAAAGSTTVTEPIFKNIQVANFAPSAGTTAISVQQPATSNITGCDLENITISISTNNATTIGVNVQGGVGIETTTSERYKISRIKVYSTAATSTNITAIKLFGMDWGTVSDLLVDDGGHTLSGYVLLGDLYHIAMHGLVVKSTSGSTSLIKLTDGQWNTISDFSVSGFSGTAVGVDLLSASAPISHNIIGPGSIKYAGAGTAGVRLIGNANGQAANYNTITGVDFFGAGTASSTGMLFQIANSSTGTNNKIIGSNFSGFNGASSIDINVANAAMSNTYIGGDNTYDAADVLPISNSGTSTVFGRTPLLCVNTTPVTVNANVTTDQNLMTCTIPAGTLNVLGKTLHVKASGVYSTAAASTAVITAEAKLCTVSGCGSGTVIDLIDIATAALGSVTVTNNNWNLDFHSTTQTIGASAAFEAHGQFVIDTAALTTTADQVYADTNSATIGTIDATAQLFLQIAYAFSAGSASNSVTQRLGIVEPLN